MSNLQELQARAAAAAAALNSSKKSQDDALETIQRLEGLVTSLTGERDGLTAELRGFKDDNQKLLLEMSQAETGRKAAEESARNLELSLEEAKGKIETLGKGKQEAEAETVDIKRRMRELETEKDGLAGMLEQLVAGIEGDAAAAASVAAAVQAEAPQAEEPAAEAEAASAEEGKPTKEDAQALVERIKNRIESNRP